MKLYYLAAWFLVFVGPAFGADFKLSNQNLQSLYNTVRIGQPSSVPWAGSYWAFANDGIATTEEGKSPAANYDEAFGKKAAAWEKSEHTCSTLEPDLKESCRAWWGHCNAWSAAAIKEPEPRRSIPFNSRSFSVADQKAYLTELWMASGALFNGNTDKGIKTGKWVLNANSPEAKSDKNHDGVNAYDSFWDVSPRMFFLIFTNYVGVLKQGVVIDRFTGDQVWNQPIVGYRILPIDPKKSEARTVNGLTIYPVHFAIKIYWANDGVAIGNLSSAFSIAKTKDDEEVENFGNDYDGRLLKFTLFFDAPVVMNGDQVSSAGNLVGQGIWYHQEHPEQFFNLDQTHPDFIWQPTVLSTGGMQNPEILNSNVRKIFAAASSATTPPSVGPVPESNESNAATTSPSGSAAEAIEVAFNRSSNFQFATIFDIKFKIQNILSRENITQPFSLVPSGSGGANLTLKLIAPQTTRETVVKLLNEAGIKTL